MSVFQGFALLVEPLGGGFTVQTLTIEDGERFFGDQFRSIQPANAVLSSPTGDIALSFDDTANIIVGLEFTNGRADDVEPVLGFTLADGRAVLLTDGDGRLNGSQLTTIGAIHLGDAAPFPFPQTFTYSRFGLTQQAEPETPTPPAPVADDRFGDNVTVLTGGDPDFEITDPASNSAFTIFLEAGRHYSFDLDDEQGDPRTSIRTQIQITDPDGARVVSVKDFSQVDVGFTAETTGVHQLDILHYGEYELIIKNDDFAEPADLALTVSDGATVIGHFSDSHDIDSFNIALGAGQTLSLGAEFLDARDDGLSLEVFSESGGRVLDLFSGGAFVTGEFTPGETGVYTVEISGFGAFSSDPRVSPYSLTFGAPRETLVFGEADDVIEITEISPQRLSIVDQGGSNRFVYNPGEGPSDVELNSMVGSAGGTNVAELPAIQLLDFIDGTAGASARRSRLEAEGGAFSVLDFIITKGDQALTFIDQFLDRDQQGPPISGAASFSAASTASAAFGATYAVSTLALGDGSEFRISDVATEARDLRVAVTEDAFLTGGAGDDWLIGFTGDDTLVGDEGADFHDGGAGFDLVSYQTANAGVTAALAAFAENDGDAAGDRYLSVEGLIGGGFADDLRGDGAANLISGLGGNDEIFGEGGDDTLIAGEGADTLFGGDGTDLARFDAGFDQIQQIIGPSAQFRIVRGAETTILNDVEFAQFGDEMVALTVNTPPTVTIDDLVLNIGETVALNDVASFFDADGQEIDQVALFDGVGASNWLVDGQPFLIDPAARPDRDAISIAADAAPGVQTLSLQAFDGVELGALTTFTLTSVQPNRAPVITVEDVSLNVGETAALSDLFTFADADGDALAQLQLTDASGGANFRINGQPVEASNGVLTGDLSAVTIAADAAASAQTLTVRASDGEAFSDAVSFTLTTVQPNRAPVVTIEDVSLSIGAATPLSAILSVTDPDGDEFAAVRLIDTAGAANWRVNDAPVDASGDGFVALDINAVTLSADAEASLQTLTVAVSDGEAFSEPVSFDLTTTQPNRAPVVTVGDISLNVGDTIALSDILGFEDADGDALVSVELTDDGGADNFRVGGQPVDATAGFVVADISAVTIAADAAAGSQTLAIRAFDGAAFSAAASFVLTTVQPNRAPTVSVTDQEIIVGETVPLAEIAEFKDLDGDAIQSVELFDETGAANWLVGGAPVDATSGFTVDDIASVSLRADASAGAQTLSLSASDSDGFGALASFSLTTTPPPPEIVTGTDAADRLFVFCEAGNRVFGLAGDDDLSSASFNDDALFGGAGNDELETTRGGDDTLDGGAGHDTLVSVNPDDERLLGGEGDDSIIAFDAGLDTLEGGDGDDILTSTGEGFRLVLGGAGDDLLSGFSTGGGRFFGEAGDDHIQTTETAAPSLADGGAGDDTLNSNAPGDTLFGGDGSDNVSASGADTSANGGAGDDRIIITGLNQSVTGGEGFDTLSVRLDRQDLRFAIEDADIVARDLSGAIRFRFDETVERIQFTGGERTETIDLTTAGGGALPPEDALPLVDPTLPNAAFPKAEDLNFSPGILPDERRDLSGFVTYGNNGAEPFFDTVEGFLFLSEDRDFSPDDFIVADLSYFDEQGPDQFGNLTIRSVQARITEADFPPGDYFLGAILDPENKLVESDETDNLIFAEAPLTIRAPGLAGADFTIGNSEVLRGQLDDGGLIGPLTFSSPFSVSLGSKGDEVIFADGSFTYRPSGQSAGEDVFLYRVSNGDLTLTRSAVINVTDDNRAPVFGDVERAAFEDTASTIFLSLFAEDPDFDPISFTIAPDGGPSNGEASVASDRLFYTPAANFFGEDEVTIIASDDRGGRTTATVTLDVRPVNDAPTAEAFGFDVDKGDSFTGQLTGADVDGDALTYRLAEGLGPTEGGVTVNPDGSFTYTAGGASGGADAFSFIVDDGRGLTAIGAVTVTLNDNPDAGVGTDQADEFTGGDDADTFDGGLGDDSAAGGGGDDTLLGGGGGDSLSGGGGKDVLTGGGGKDHLQGNGGKDLLQGNGGKDTLQGGGGRDTLEGGGGTDLLEGGGGRDLLLGGGGRDVLDGGGGKDTMEGGNGRDQILGGRGSDTLTGDGGNDLFIFDRGNGRDTITDFQQNRDKIVIQGGAADFAALEITQAGDDVLIRIANTRVTIEDDLVENFTAGDFIF